MNVGRLEWIGRTLKRASCGSVILAIASCSEPTETALPAPLRVQPAAEVRAQQGPPTWTTKALGALPGNNFSIAYDISDTGIVVGQSHGGSAPVLPFFWTKAGGMKQLAL